MLISPGWIADAKCPDVVNLRRPALANRDVESLTLTKSDLGAESPNDWCLTVHRDGRGGIERIRICDSDLNCDSPGGADDIITNS